MTLIRSRLLAALLAAAFSWALPAGAQESEARPPGTGSSYPSEDFEVARFLANADELPAELSESLAALRESQALIRSAWIAGYRPEAGASFEELKAAQESFQRDFAGEVESSKRLKSELLKELRAAGIPTLRSSDGGGESDEMYVELRESQSNLAKAWAAVRLELGDSPTRLELLGAKKRFHEKNADLIARCRFLSSQVRGRGNDPSLGRDGLPSELQDLRRDMTRMRGQVRRRHAQSSEALRSLPAEERAEHRQKLLEEMRELHREVGARRRQVLERARD